MEQELYDALHSKESNSAPGDDGISYSFYKTFYRDLKHVLLDCMNTCLRRRNLPESQKRGLISLIPKGDKDQRRIPNWRPICLLNCLYKIQSILANRLAEALPEVIALDQTGFLKERFISENTLTTALVIEKALRTKQKGIMVAIDF
ncbi:MAG: hypothetical protein GY696_25040 [Gammaproteobacteria bacterium]|nr:hypothetical protein [Gammaproteobacteria bacterium]